MRFKQVSVEFIRVRKSALSTDVWRIFFPFMKFKIFIRINENSNQMFWLLIHTPFNVFNSEEEIEKLQFKWDTNVNL